MENNSQNIEDDGKNSDTLEDSEIIMENNLKNGKQDGLCQIWNENGQIEKKYPLNVNMENHIATLSRLNVLQSLLSDKENKEKVKDFNQIVDTLVQIIFTDNQKTLNEISRQIGFAKEVYDWMNSEFQKQQKNEN